MLSLTSKLRPLVARPVCLAAFSTGKKGKNPSKYQQTIDAASIELDLRRMAVGGGDNMAEAIITGLLTRGLIPSSKAVVSDLNPNMHMKYTKLNVETHSRNSSAVKGADVILVAVKPQVLDDALMDPAALIISVVAGRSIKQLQMLLGESSRIIRTMPNTPAMIGEGTTVWAQSAEVTSKQHELTKNILGSFGVEVFVDDENALDMATALSGSGPSKVLVCLNLMTVSYFFLVAEAMIDTDVHLGFSRPVATKLVQQTVLGSAMYMQSENVHPVELRNNITSPGCTTAAGLYRAEKNGFRAVIADFIWAAYERCLELGSPEPIQRQLPPS
ncbi:hypothetical protein PsorP6_017467 [Peronosclerospora sorghi]|uniref:Uncharacterized protein n=1 Tax=Peronosclerospora sorghi TaxID=230839 RepID=A0ACC0WL24_9STRA|nr:hypothetical protein PsorP6_017467 [Peronosclerospora sorghi]